MAESSPARRRCAAQHAGPDGCPAPPGWLIILREPGRYEEAAACSRHLSRVCLQMLGCEAHALTVKPIGVRVPWLSGVTIGG